MARARHGRRYRENRTRILRGSPACHICGQPIDTSLPHWIVSTDGRRTINPMAATADHIIPVAKGGGDSLSNLKPAHMGCNRSRSDKDYAPIVRRSGTLK